MNLASCLEAARAATPDTLPEAQPEVYRRMFEASLLEAETDQVLEALHKSTKVTKTSLKRDWKAFLARSVERQQRQVAGTDADPAEKRAGQYLVLRGAIHREHQTQDGPVAIPLANFDARIVREETRDDGAEQTTAFIIDGKLASGRQLPAVEVTSGKYAAMAWVTEAWGAQALVEAGSSTKDHLRAAIQKLSGDVPRHQVFAHLGWRRTSEGWAYLHAGGAITAYGQRAGVEVAPADNRLTGFELPAPPADTELAESIRASLEVLELAPDEVTVPLLAAVYRAPLGEALPIDFSLFLIGVTGTFKTELTSVAQAHYGTSFTGRNLPANWSSTANALEKEAFMAKDAVLVVDDFSPTGTPNDVARMHRDAERLLRAQGNHAGRDRMNADGSLRATYYPRGLIISSGEDAPKGHSLRSRVYFVEIDGGRVNLERLTTLQGIAAGGTLARAMSGYVRWLAPQMEGLDTGLADLHRELRIAAGASDLHRRTPDQVASLAVGLHMLLSYAVDAHAVNPEESTALWERAWAALARTGMRQAHYLGVADPVERFRELLAAAISSGTAHVADARSSEAPQDGHRWGWRFHESTPMGGWWEPQGRRIGWIANDALLLEPDSAYAAAQRLAREQGDNLTMSQQQLWRNMKERKLLTTTEPERTTRRRTLAGEQRHVLHLAPSYLSTGAIDAAPERPSLAGQALPGGDPQGIREALQG